MDDFTAGPIMCSGSTIYRSLVESQLKAGDWAVFPGGMSRHPFPRHPRPYILSSRESSHNTNTVQAAVK